MGKTRLIEVAVRMASEFNLINLFGFCESLEKDTPFYPWGAVYAKLFGGSSAILFINPHKYHFLI